MGEGLVAAGRLADDLDVAMGLRRAADAVPQIA